MNEEDTDTRLKFSEFPVEIYESIAEYLENSSYIVLSHCCQSLRSYFLARSFLDCYVPTNDKFSTTNLHCRTIPLKAFLRPKNYGSWFHWKHVKSIELEGEPTSSMIALLSERTHHSPLYQYCSLANFKIKVPSLINKPSMIDYVLPNLQNYLLMLRIIDQAQFESEEPRFKCDLEITHRTFAPIERHLGYVTVLHLIGYKEDPSLVTFTGLRWITEFWFVPIQDTPPETYFQFFNAISWSPFLNRVTFTLYHDSDEYIGVCERLPTGLEYCKLQMYLNCTSAYQFEHHFPPILQDSIYIDQITHLYIRSDSKYISPNSVLPRLELPNIMSLEGNTHDKVWNSMLAVDNIWHFTFLSLGIVDDNFEDLLPQYRNIETLDTGGFCSNWRPNMPVHSLLISNMDNLTTLSLSTNTVSFFYKEMFELLDFRNPQDILKKRYFEISAILETLSMIHSFFDNAADTPEFMSTMTGSAAQDAATNIANSDFSMFEFVLSKTHSDLDEQEISFRWDEIEFKDPYIPDYEIEFLDGYFMVQKILDSLDDPLFSEPFILLELIMRPEIVSMMSSSQPIAFQEHFSKLRKLFNKPNYNPETPTDYFSLREHLCLNSSSDLAYLDPCKWTHLSSFSYLNEGNSTTEIMISIVSYILSVYAEREHLMKTILQSLPNLESLTIHNDSPFIAHAFWFQTLVKNHPKLKEVLTPEPSEIYEHLEKRVAKLGRLFDADYFKNKREDKFFQRMFPPFLQNHVYRTKKIIKDINNNREIRKYIKIDVDSLRNGYATFDSMQHDRYLSDNILLRNLNF